MFHEGPAIRKELEGHFDQFFFITDKGPVPF
jgi:hypothetical protein